MESFEIRVDDGALVDLRNRLAETRWPEAIDDNNWDYGSELSYIQALCRYWLNTYDWRAQEAAINAEPQFRTEIDGVPLHFIHKRGVGPRALPLILSHGWPWTFWDYRKLIGPLTDPAAHGGDADDAFDVVIPSLPGFGFSTPLHKAGVDFTATAELWVKLMRDTLGYDRFAAQGGDFGALVTSQLGHANAHMLHGIHLHFLLPVSSGGGAGLPAENDYGPDEEGWFDRNRQFLRTATGYSAIQRTKPQTISYALNDSPIGLLAWIVEKRHAWSDNGGDIETVFSKNDLITTAMIYWLTESYGSSARYYAEPGRAGWTAAHDRMPMVEAPTAALIYPHEVLKMPRRWSERYFNLRRWALAETGGHFAPMEAPDALVDDIRTFLRPCRHAPSGVH